MLTLSPVRCSFILNSPSNIISEIISPISAQYELGNDVLVSYQLKSVYRFFLKMKELNATHLEIFEFLRRTPNMTPDLVRDEFIALKKRLLIVQNKRFEKRSGLYLDIISWLESKIDNRPVQDVIAEKFELQRAQKTTGLPFGSKRPY